jgi:hypothetical protein
MLARRLFERRVGEVLGASVPTGSVIDYAPFQI